MTDKPAAPAPEPTVTICQNCGKPIVQDSSGRGWRHGKIGSYRCCDTFATPAPASSPLPSAPATPTMRNTAERANRAAERIWREFVDDSKRDIKKIRDIICIYLVAERDQARGAPASSPLPGAPAQQLYATEYPTNLMGATVPAPPSPAPIDRASWQAGVSAAIKQVANMVFDVHEGYLSDSIVRELQSLEPPFPAPVASTLTRFRCDCGRELLVEGKVIGKNIRTALPDPPESEPK